MLRGLSIFVLEVLPWALASLIGLALLASHFAGHPSRADARPVAAPVAAQVASAVVAVTRSRGWP